MFYVYFLASRLNGKKYVGMTSKNPEQRIGEHNSGSNSWTRANGPFDLVYYENYVCEQDARRRELFYKTGIGRRAKDAIIAEFCKKLA